MSSDMEEPNIASIGEELSSNVDAAYSCVRLGVSVGTLCVLVTTGVSFAKTDEPIEMPFGGRLPTRYPIDDVMTLESHSPTDNR